MPALSHCLVFPAPPLIRRVPWAGSPASSVLLSAPTPLRPSRHLRSPMASGTSGRGSVRSVGRPLGGLGHPTAGSGSPLDLRGSCWLSEETKRPPRFLGIPCASASADRASSRDTRPPENPDRPEAPCRCQPPRRRGRQLRDGRGAGESPCSSVGLADAPPGLRAGDARGRQPWPAGRVRRRHRAAAPRRTVRRMGAERLGAAVPGRRTQQSDAPTSHPTDCGPPRSQTVEEIAHPLDDRPRARTRTGRTRAEPPTAPRRAPTPSTSRSGAERTRASASSAIEP